MKNFSSKTLLTLFAVVVFFSCSKRIDEKQLSPIEASAHATLKMKMTKEDFANLNWKDAIVKTLNGIEFLIEIPTISNNSKKLIYSKDGLTEVYNYYEIRISQTNKMQQSGSLVLSAIDNKKLHEYLIFNNKIVHSLEQILNKVNSMSIKKNDLSDLFLPDVFVYATIKNNLGVFGNYISLYWLFDGYSNYASQYAGFNSDIVMDANAVLAGTNFLYDANATTLSNGKKQMSFNFKDAFAASGLDVTFTIDPATNLLDETSVVTAPGGGGRLGSPVSVFIGAWTQIRVQDISYASGNLIEFSVAARNTVSPGLGVTVGARYSLTIQLNTSNNQVTARWN